MCVAPAPLRSFLCDPLPIPCKALKVVSVLRSKMRLAAFIVDCATQGKGQYNVHLVCDGGISLVWG